MSADRMITRSMKAAIDKSSSPPRKKLKATQFKQPKPKPDTRKTSTIRKIGTSLNKTKTTQQRGNVQPLPERKSLYEVVEKDSFNIWLEEYPFTCTVACMCLLDSGDLLLADPGNKILKRINGETYKLRDILKLESAVNAVCTVNEIEAVTVLSSVSNRTTIQFVSVQEELVATRSFVVEHYCIGIGVLAGKLFIGDGKNVHIYDMDGKRLGLVDGGSIFTWNRYFVESDDKTALYVTDRDEVLIKMDADGRVIWKCKAEACIGAFGLCTDGAGNVFVSGFDSKNIVQISSEGQYLGEVVPPNLCTRMASAVAFDRLKSKLFVAGYAQKQMLVYQLK